MRGGRLRRSRAAGNLATLSAAGGTLTLPTVGGFTGALNYSANDATPGTIARLAVAAVPNAISACYRRRTATQYSPPRPRLPEYTWWS
jgi:hypothetical protein